MRRYITPREALRHLWCGLSRGSVIPGPATSLARRQWVSRAVTFRYIALGRFSLQLFCHPWCDNCGTNVGC